MSSPRSLDSGSLPICLCVHCIKCTNFISGRSAKHIAERCRIASFRHQRLPRDRHTPTAHCYPPCAAELLQEPCSSEPRAQRDVPSDVSAKGWNDILSRILDGRVQVLHIAHDRVTIVIASRRDTPRLVMRRWRSTAPLPLEMRAL